MCKCLNKHHYIIFHIQRKTLITENLLLKIIILQMDSDAFLPKTSTSVIELEYLPQRWKNWQTAAIQFDIS